MVSATTEYVLEMPTLYPKQREAIYSPARIAVIEATTKAGKTVGCITWQLERAWMDDKTHLWIAPIYPQSRIAHDRICRFLHKADPAKDAWQYNKSDLSVTLASGAKMICKGGDDPDSIYGYDYADAVIDEATRCKEEVWYAVRSTLTATRGPVRIIGNVKGRKNWAYRMARQAEAGAPDMSYAKITAHDAVEAGVLAAEEIEEARRQLPINVFNELYLAIPSDDGGNPFGLQHIRECVVPTLAPGPVVCWGVDLAKSHDWVVAIGFNEHGKTCAFQRWQGSWRNTRARLCAMIKELPALIDSTGVGDPIVEDIKTECPNAEGYTFTSKSKQQLMEGLAVSVQSHEVSIPEFANSQPCPLGPEMESFEYEIKEVDGHYRGVTYSAPAGMFDDCVCSLGLTVRCFQTMASAPRLYGLGTRDDDFVDRFASDYDEHEDAELWSPM